MSNLNKHLSRYVPGFWGGIDPPFGRFARSQHCTTRGSSPFSPHAFWLSSADPAASSGTVKINHDDDGGVKGIRQFPEQPSGRLVTVVGNSLSQSAFKVKPSKGGPDAVPETASIFRTSGNELRFYQIRWDLP